jgi:hypothetical protein
MSSHRGSQQADDAARFAMEAQHADAISNVAGNQYNSRVQHQYKLDALRIAPMRARARMVMRLGLIALVLGLAVVFVGDYIWQQSVTTCIRDNADNFSCARPIGLTLMQLGSAVFVGGVITVITSLFMKRGVRRREELL